MPVLRAALLSLALAACSDGGFEVGALGTLEASPARVEFLIDRVAPDAAEEQTVTLTNLGAGELRVTGLHLVVRDALGEAPVELIAPAPPLFLPPDPAASFPLRLRYTRMDDRPRDLALVVVSSDPRLPRLEVPVEIRRGQAELRALPAQVVFRAGTQLPAMATVRLVNLGTAPVTLSSMRLMADPAFECALGGAAVGGRGPLEVTFPAPVVIAAGAEAPLGVVFAPRDALPTSGRLVLFGDAGTEQGFPVPLVGNDAGPCVLVRPSIASFGPKPLDSLSELPIEVENCGGEPLEVTGLRLSEDADLDDPTLTAAGLLHASSPRFELDADASEDTPWRLAPAEIRTATLRYRAWSLADYEADRARPEDLGAVIVTSRSLVPVRVVAVSARTDHRDPTDIAGCEWEGGVVARHAVKLRMTADDAYEVWVDGDKIARDEAGWQSIDTYELELDSGCHVLGIHAWDTHAVRSGLIAVIEVDGVVRWTSGDQKPEWSVTGPEAPPADWQDLFFDDATWTDPRACSSTSVWGSVVGELERGGARWVWWNTDCNDLSNAYFRLTFTVD